MGREAVELILSSRKSTNVQNASTSAMPAVLPPNTQTFHPLNNDANIPLLRAKAEKKFWKKIVNIVFQSNAAEVLTRESVMNAIRHSDVRFRIVFAGSTNWDMTSGTFRGVPELTVEPQVFKTAMGEAIERISTEKGDSDFYSDSNED